MMDCYLPEMAADSNKQLFMGIWPAITKNNLTQKNKTNEVLFVYLFLFCVALSSSTSSEAEDLSSAFKGADDIFSAF